MDNVQAYYAINNVQGKGTELSSSKDQQMVTTIENPYSVTFLRYLDLYGM